MKRGQPVVSVVDDDWGVRNSLRWLVESEGLAVDTFATAEAFLDACDPEQPGCLVLDVKMPGMSGLDLQRELVQRRIMIPVIIISGHADVQVAVRAFKMGAVDLLEKPFSDDDLLERIRVAIEKDRETRAWREERAAAAARIALLTRREKQVLEMVVKGSANKEIAAELGLSLKTVEVHRSRVMEKMQVGSLAELVRLVVHSEETLEKRP
jgi:two-component system response regulator FixJ